MKIFSFCLLVCVLILPLPLFGFTTPEECAFGDVNYFHAFKGRAIEDVTFYIDRNSYKELRTHIHQHPRLAGLTREMWTRFIVEATEVWNAEGRGVPLKFGGELLLQDFKKMCASLDKPAIIVTYQPGCDVDEETNKCDSTLAYVWDDLIKKEPSCIGKTANLIVFGQNLLHGSLSKNIDWSVEDKRDSYSLKGTLVHEFGHVLGLDHPNQNSIYNTPNGINSMEEKSVMNSYIFYGGQEHLWPWEQACVAQRWGRRRARVRGATYNHDNSFEIAKLDMEIPQPSDRWWFYNRNDRYYITDKGSRLGSYNTAPSRFLLQSYYYYMLAGVDVTKKYYYYEVNSTFMGYADIKDPSLSAKYKTPEQFLSINPTIVENMSGSPHLFSNVYTSKEETTPTVTVRQYNTSSTTPGAIRYGREIGKWLQENALLVRDRYGHETTLKSHIPVSITSYYSLMKNSRRLMAAVETTPSSKDQGAIRLYVNSSSDLVHYRKWDELGELGENFPIFDSIYEGDDLVRPSFRTAWAPAIACRPIPTDLVSGNIRSIPEHELNCMLAWIDRGFGNGQILYTSFKVSNAMPVKKTIIKKPPVRRPLAGEEDPCKKNRYEDQYSGRYKFPISDMWSSPFDKNFMGGLARWKEFDDIEKRLKEIECNPRTTEEEVFEYKRPVITWSRMVQQVPGAHSANHLSLIQRNNDFILAYKSIDANQNARFVRLHLPTSENDDYFVYPDFTQPIGEHLIDPPTLSIISYYKNASSSPGTFDRRDGENVVKVVHQDSNPFYYNWEPKDKKLEQANDFITFWTEQAPSPEQWYRMNQ